MKAEESFPVEISELVSFIRENKLEAPAIFLLESLYPLRGVFSMMTDFVDPIGKLICPVWTSRLQDLLRSPENYRAVIAACEG